MIARFARSLLLLLLLLRSPSSIAAADDAKCVVVSGATGWVAGHVVEVLMQKGYTIHGTVRDKSNAKKIAHLKALEDKYAPSTGTKLVLFNADLASEAPFDEAAAGCETMLHVASPVVRGGMTKHAQVDVAVRGTLSALEAAAKSGMKAVVVTSSVASLSPSVAKMDMTLADCAGKPYDEKSINDYATLDRSTYAYSKVRAEQATDAWMEEHGSPFRLATMHFAMAWGPQQSTRVTSSQKVIEMLATGKHFLAPPVPFHFVDVRDVARAHVHVLEHEAAKGRFIIAPGTQETTAASFAEMGAALRAAKDLVGRMPTPPTTRLHPLFFELARYVSPLVDERAVAAAWRGHSCGYDGTKLVRELGFEYKYENMDETVVAAVRSMLDLGIADGQRHMDPAGIILLAAPMMPIVMLLLCYRCCCSSRAASNGDGDSKKER